MRIKQILSGVGVVLCVLNMACQKGSDNSGLGDTATKTVSPDEVLKNDKFQVYKPTSVIYLTTIKDSAIPVKASLGFAEGTLQLASADAFLALTVDLESFDSGLPLRNDRVRKIFFNSDKKEMSQAIFKIAALPGDALAKLKADKELKDYSLEGELDFHGVKKNITAKLNASITPAGRIAVKSVQPLEIKISDFSLSENLKSMIQVCGHLGIDDLVKLDVAVEFEVKK